MRTRPNHFTSLINLWIAKLIVLVLIEVQCAYLYRSLLQLIKDSSIYFEIDMSPDEAAT